MITLKELLQLNETVTLLKLYVRQPDGYLIRRSIIGQPYKLTRFQEDDMEKGKLEYIDADINRYGRVGRSGMTEMCYGMDWKVIPKKYLDAEVTPSAGFMRGTAMSTARSLTAVLCRYSWIWIVHGNDSKRIFKTIRIRTQESTPVQSGV